VEVENHHFIMAEVGNLEALVQNDGLDPIGEIQTGIYIYIIKYIYIIILYICYIVFIYTNYIPHVSFLYRNACQ
jgi:hypothetical protein